MEQNKTRAYLFYAVGEIALVMIGILLALQINNWNEQKKLHQKFNSTLNKVYNDLIFDTSQLQGGVGRMNRQISMMDTLLKMPDYYPIEQLPGRLLFIDWPTSDFNFTENVAFNNSLLNFSELDQEQSDLANLIYTYGYTASNSYGLSPFIMQTPIHEMMQDQNVPTPPTYFLNSIFDDEYLANFTDSQRKRVREIVLSEKFKAVVTTQRALRIGSIEGLTNSQSEIEFLRQSIKEYYPEVSFYYNDIGIVGSALAIGWTPSQKISLNVSPENGFIYEGIFDLNDGEVKFVADDNWAINWGKNIGTENVLSFMGDNITVQKGKYHVTIDFEQNTYSFNLIPANK